MVSGLALQVGAQVYQVAQDLGVEGEILIRWKDHLLQSLQVGGDGLQVREVRCGLSLDGLVQEAHLLLHRLGLFKLVLLELT